MSMDAAWCGMAMEDGGASSAPHDSPAFWRGPLAARSHSHSPLPPPPCCPRRMECWRATRGVRIRRFAFAPGKASPCASGPLPSSSLDAAGTACNVPCLPVMPCLQCPASQHCSPARRGQRCAPGLCTSSATYRMQGSSVCLGTRVSGRAGRSCVALVEGCLRIRYGPGTECERRPETDKSSMPSIWGCYCSGGLSKRRFDISLCADAQVIIHPGQQTSHRAACPG